MAKSKKVALVKPDDCKREFINCFRGFSQQYQPWSIFSHFVEMAALAFSNRCDLRHYAEREERYMALINSYERDEDRRRFPELIGLASLAFAKFGPHDFFGEIFGFNGLDLGNGRLGQIFTPYHMSLMMAKMTLLDCKPLIEKEGFITMLEPASGSGGMIAAAAEAVSDQGFDCREVLHVTAVDIDLRCTHMSYLTCCLLGLPAVVYNGNSLSMQMNSTWFTPAHVFGGWGAKLEAKREGQTYLVNPHPPALQAAE